ncbi:MULTISPECIES: rRNA maturation RNase YbeY [unclassified Dehalobacter]|uniref:rRNA maturation RNase YbeY n=1 Tax=unclassified Dehalobacter TaxID=2635733 RepID=UPI000E6CE9CA|nr:MULTISPECIES: rRNA maturation RNase YbeY [unclassified Dehalobacter]RJE47126.1 rRNA maturation RNase YbeY [Dehalobacter sp. MCB1]TCX53712.1 rRNA maturation RNase YbeY [Dehalobacter sp. 14DCB1]TCX55015.1 rRNA maturation RNase YbeY [Dehalobacter sp. 12DCB1]
MELDISWEDDSITEDEQNKIAELLRTGIQKALLEGGGPEDAEIGLVLTDDESIYLLNKTYRGINSPTDVLSFALREKGEGEPEIYYNPQSDKDKKERLEYSLEEMIDEEDEEDLDEYEEDDDNFSYCDTALGDIVISVERARSQAIEYGHSFAREIVYLAVHGTLHLLGYDHGNEDDSSVMRRLEEQVMDQLGLLR